MPRVGISSQFAGSFGVIEQVVELTLKSSEESRDEASDLRKRGSHFRDGVSTQTAGKPRFCRFALYEGKPTEDPRQR